MCAMVAVATQRRMYHIRWCNTHTSKRTVDLSMRAMAIISPLDSTVHFLLSLRYGTARTAHMYNTIHSYKIV